jgi:hypothetical protein
MAVAAPVHVVDMELSPWRAVNDGVMGGISRGEMVSAGGGLRFQGALSLENNGGFASVWRSFDGDLGDARGVRLRVRGDGRRYHFRVRLDGGSDGVAWRATFNTDGSWQTVDLPFSDFVPTFRGRRVTDAGPVIPSAIRQLGFLVADGEEGAFQVDIRAIERLLSR